MARKTVVKRLAKYLPLSPELAKAIEIDNERFGYAEMTNFSVSQDPPPTTPGARSEALVKKIRPKDPEVVPEPEPDPADDLPDAEPMTEAPVNELDAMVRESATPEEPPAHVSQFDDGDSDREWILNELGDEPWPARYKALKADDALPKGFPYRKAIDGYDGNEQDTIRTAMGG